MSCEDLLECEYNHFHPYSASKFRMEEIFGSSYFHLFSVLDDSEIKQEVAYEKAQADHYYNEQVPYELQLMEQEKAREKELLQKYGSNMVNIDDSDSIDMSSENQADEEESI